MSTPTNPPSDGTTDHVPTDVIPKKGKAKKTPTPLVTVTMSTPGLHPHKGKQAYLVTVTYTEVCVEEIIVEADNEREAEDRALEQFDFVTGSIDEVTIIPKPLELEE